MKFYISACAVARNETPYLKEWVAFHKLVGIEHFYIYDDESDIPVAETLKEFIQEGSVDVFPAFGRKQQIKTFGDCHARFKKDTYWLAYLDIDEYLFPTDGRVLKPLLARYDRKNIGALGVHWVMYGSSGHKQAQEGLTIENYLLRAGDNFVRPNSYPDNTHIKSIVIPRRVSAVIHPHWFPMLDGYVTVNEKYETLEHPRDNVHTSKIFRINHYWTRSREEFIKKIQRGRNETSRPLNEWEIDSLDEEATIRDEKILRYLPALKKSLGISEH